MTTASWFLTSIFFWLIGYFYNLITPIGLSKNLILIPNWLKPILGSPKNKGFPVGTMSANGVFFQILGILILIYALIIERFVLNKALSPAVGFIGCLVISFIFVGILTDVWRYE